ncbi:uncharacterized protein LOC108672560 [Hyalella azteca]|uniref:Uncharacterized protein LOC108672560 n=1 Tax=Hyalella azteca TaxID=294128 RepID=A0A8B7NPV1_HYAAZ|nr:uncharacterized protein LOC108672560 [Hyalella azteca]
MTYSEHVRSTASKAKKNINILKAVSGADWGKDTETIVQTYKALIRPVLEYGSSIWGPITSESGWQKIQTVQNSALRIATGHTRDTNAQHLHDETSVLPLKNHVQMMALQLREKSKLEEHPLRSLMNQEPIRLMKKTIYNSEYSIKVYDCNNSDSSVEVNRNMKTLHTTAVERYLESRTPDKILNAPAPKVNEIERTLDRGMRRTLAR